MTVEATRPAVAFHKDDAPERCRRRDGEGDSGVSFVGDAFERHCLEGNVAFHETVKVTVMSASRRVTLSSVVVSEATVLSSRR